MATFNPNGRKKQPEPYPGFFTPPAGREIAAGFVSKYGTGTRTQTVPGVQEERAAPTIGTEPFPDIAAAPAGTAPYVEPPDDGSNIIEADFAAATAAEDVGLPNEPDDWQVAHDARMLEVQDQMDRIAGIAGRVDAAINGQPMPPAAEPAAPAPQGATTPAPKSAYAAPSLDSFRGKVGTPITFDGPNAWAPGDEVGFNDSEIQRQNPKWAGSKSWTPSAGTMSGGYDGSVMASPSRGTPVQPHNYSEQTKRFYDRAAARGDTRRIRNL